LYMRIIKVLTNKDAKHFNNEAPKYDVVIAGFFMVKCPACESFKPAWNNFVKSCENKAEPRVLIAEVDSNQTSNVDFDTSTLEGFPTVYRDVKSIEGTSFFKGSDGCQKESTYKKTYARWEKEKHKKKKKK